MKSVVKLLLFSIGSFFLFACAGGHHGPFTDEPASVRQIKTLEQSLQNAVSASRFLSMEVIGNVKYENFSAPIWVLAYKSDSNTSHQILLGAGIHGNEPAGVECVVKFVGTLARNPQSFTGLTFHIIPVVNPWGWSHNIRFNKDGIDINRDFAVFKSQEARIIRELVHGKKYDLMIDLHEDPSAEGFYLYQYGRRDDTVCRQIIAAVRKMGYPVEQNVNMIILKTKDGLIDAPMWGLWYMKFSRQLSITNYFRLNHSKNVFTMETPIKLPMKDRLTMQTTAINIFLHDLEKM